MPEREFFEKKKRFVRLPQDLESEQRKYIINVKEYVRTWSRELDVDFTVELHDTPTVHLPLPLYPPHKISLGLYSFVFNKRMREVLRHYCTTFEDRFPPFEAWTRIFFDPNTYHSVGVELHHDPRYVRDADACEVVKDLLRYLTINYKRKNASHAARS